jgi:hypothetical protein
VQDKEQISTAVEGFLSGLIEQRAPACSRGFRRSWRTAWGRSAYGDRVTDAELLSVTEQRRQLMWQLFRSAAQAVASRGITAEDAHDLRLRLQPRRRDLRPAACCVAVAIDAALAAVTLKARPPIGSVALCYSAFGDVDGVARRYAAELAEVLGGICRRLAVFAGVGLKTIPAEQCETKDVEVHLRSIHLAELVAFPGIKAPGLIGACADAVRQGIDIVITVDGDGRLPLFQILPAIAALVEDAGMDAVLGSRRVAGALVAKPGLRHCTSWLNASYVNTLMGPVFGSHVFDPQGIFKIYRGRPLGTALQRLGIRDAGLELNDLQDGSLACELLLLAHLRDDGPPRLVEVAVVEIMAYAANSARMPILSADNVSAMKLAANRIRRCVRGQSLVGEGSEYVVLRDAEGAVLKIPRYLDRLGVRPLLPTSLVTDNRLLHCALALPGPLRSFCLALACRRHPDRGFGPGSSLGELMADTRSAVRDSLPKNGRWTFRHHSLRLPIGTALVLALGWSVDRLMLRAVDLIERVGMLPACVIRFLGACLRIARCCKRALSICLRPTLRAAGRVVRFALRTWDVVRPLLMAALRRGLYALEVVGVLRVFAGLDRLDQRSPLFRRLTHAVLRALVELRWLLEGIDICIDFGRPILSLVQPTPARPVAQVLHAVPSLMTAEVREILRLAIRRYRTLGEHGYFDGELSLDNLGFEMTEDGVRVVLLDGGAVVSSRAVPPAILADWLKTVKSHYTRSYQTWALNEWAAEDPDKRPVAAAFVSNAILLMDRWIRTAEKDYERNIRHAPDPALPVWAGELLGLEKAG